MISLKKTDLLFYIKTEVVFYQVLEYEVGRDSLRQASHTPWAVDSVQFTCVEPDHVNLTA